MTTKEQHAKNMRRWRKRNKERHRIYMREYAAKNRDKILQWRRENYQRHKERYVVSRRKYYAKNRQKVIRINNEWRKRNKDKDRHYGQVGTARLKDQAIAAYGGKCSCCGEMNREFLTIDHPRGRKTIGHSKRMCGAHLYRWLRNNGYPKKDFRLLCMNCNFSIGMYGFCPHERTAARVIA